MMAELVGGPGDGILMEVPDQTQIWVVQQPPMTPAEFIAMDNAPPLMDFAMLRPREHAYRLTRRLGVQSGAHLFVYVGERVAQ